MTAPGFRVLYPDPVDEVNVGAIRGRVLPANPFALASLPAPARVSASRAVSSQAEMRKSRDPEAYSPRDNFSSEKQKWLSKNQRATSHHPKCKTVYWVGSVICVKPTVLIDRNRGERGGSHCGPSVKF